MLNSRIRHPALGRWFLKSAGVVALVAIVSGASPPARGASSSLAGPLSGWSKGDVPSTTSMYEYVPAKVAATPPILVIAHNCGGTAASMFAWGSEIVTAADQYGFVIVYPQTSNSCWDVSSKTTETRSSNSDSHAIMEMVDYAVKQHTGNANRVYAAGVSSGAMMTELLMAVYPDVFKAGSEFSGTPAGCGNVFDGAGLCGDKTAPTAQQWGDSVRAMDPGYTGFRPRLQLWHGNSDATIAYQNQLEAIKEWTNVLGLSTDPTTPSATVTISSHSWEHESWQSSCGYNVLDVWSEVGGPHNTDAPLNGKYVIPFLGLDNTGGADPEVAACGDGGVRDGGSGDAIGMGGTSGTAGSGGSAGAKGSGGAIGVGSGGAGAAGTSGSGGSQASGGATGSGGAQGSGGAAGTGGAKGSGGASASGGSLGSGGSSAAGGTTGSTNGEGGSTTGNTSASSSGCSCELGRDGRGRSNHAPLLLLAPLGLVLVRRPKDTR